MPDGSAGARRQGQYQRLRTFWKSTWTVAQYEPQPMRVGTPMPENREKGGMPMPIKWIILRIGEARDMVEEFMIQAAEPLETGKDLAQISQVYC